MFDSFTAVPMKHVMKHSRWEMHESQAGAQAG